MKKIVRFRFPALNNMEFVIVVPHIVSILTKYSVVTKQLDKRFAALKAFLPELDKIEAQERKWRDAKSLKEYDHSRDAYITVLIRTERTYSRTVIPGYEDASKKFTALFDKHGRNIVNERNTAKTQRIFNLVEDIERTPGMLDVIAIFALTPAYNAMKESNKNFDALWQQRNKELSEVEHVDTKSIRINCAKSIKALYEGVEYWAVESDNPEWTQLIAELSQLGSYYDQQIRARETRRKNKENTEEELPIQPQN